nr:hypothetical protein [Tanacetum cinerariifolium]
IFKQHTKCLGEGSSMVYDILDNLDEPSDSSSLESKDEKRFLTTDDEACQKKFDDERKTTDDSKKAKDAKDVDEQAREEQAMDEQDRIKQVGKGQAKVSVLEPQVETHVVQLLSSSLTLSSAKYVNQFINDNPDVSLTDVLKEPVEAEVQSMVDVPNHQENPPV